MGQELVRRGTRSVIGGNMLVRRIDDRRTDRGMAPERLVVTHRDPATCLAPTGEIGQLREQHGGLQRVEAAVRPTSS